MLPVSTLTKAAATALIIGLGQCAFVANAADPVVDTWKFGSSDVGTHLASDRGYTYSGRTSGHKVKVSGWYADDWGRDWNNASSDLKHWSGGISLDRSSDVHATDNQHEYEFVLFEFEKPVSLQTFKYGWVSGDSDTSIMYYDDVLAGANSVSDRAFGDKGTASIVTSGSNRTELKFDDVGTSPSTNSTITNFSDSLTKRGFRLLDGSSLGGSADGPEAFADVGTHSTTTTVGQNAGSSVFSYLWAIGADFFETNSDHYDGGKLQQITALWHDTPPPGDTPVPVPASIALMAFGALLVRRKLVS